MRHSTPTDYRQHTRPVPPARTGAPDHLARKYGYMPSRPPSTEARIAYLEEMVEWLADQLEDVENDAAEGRRLAERVFYEDAA